MWVFVAGVFFGRTGESDRAAGETSKRRVHRLSHFILIAGWNRTGTVPAHRGRNASRQPGENSDICGAPPSRPTPDSRKTPRRGIYISHPPTRIQLHTHSAKRPKLSPHGASRAAIGRPAIRASCCEQYGNNRPERAKKAP